MNTKAKAHFKGDVTGATIHLLMPNGTVLLVRDAHIQNIPRYLTPFKKRTKPAKATTRRP